MHTNHRRKNRHQSYLGWTSSKIRRKLAVRRERHINKYMIRCERYDIPPRVRHRCRWCGNYMFDAEFCIC